MTAPKPRTLQMPRHLETAPLPIKRAATLPWTLCSSTLRQRCRPRKGSTSTAMDALLSPLSWTLSEGCSTHQDTSGLTCACTLQFVAPALHRCRRSFRQSSDTQLPFGWRLLWLLSMLQQAYIRARVDTALHRVARPSSSSSLAAAHLPSAPPCTQHCMLLACWLVVLL